MRDTHHTSNLATPSVPAARTPKPAAEATTGRQKYSLYHHGENEDVFKAWMAPYADLFIGAGRVLDLGCGPGVFLELLSERLVPCLGIDVDEAMVARCRERGFEAEVGDARQLSEQQAAFGGIHLGHIIEHMDGPSAVDLLERCVAALKPRGVLVVRTPNWRNEAVRRGGFWLDHTHVRPYPLELLERIFGDLGLQITHKGYEEVGWNDVYIVGKRPAS